MVTAAVLLPATLSQPRGVQIRRAGAGTEARLRCARQVWTSPEWLDQASDGESWERESEAAQASVSMTTRAAA